VKVKCPAFAGKNSRLPREGNSAFFISRSQNMEDRFMEKRINLTVIIILIFIALYPCVTSANLIKNGSFESGEHAPVSGFIRIHQGETYIPSWDVVSGEVDWTAQFTAADGSRCIDLSGYYLGAIQQSFATEIGSKYRVSFFLAGNPHNQSSGYLIKSLNVLYNNEKKLFTFDITGKTITNMGWEEISFDFIASSSITTLRFESVSPLDYGPVIDNVSVVKVYPVPLPGALLLLLEN
jgi:choice-of-anchor C domain-containing protein